MWAAFFWKTMFIVYSVENDLGDFKYSLLYRVNRLINKMINVISLLIYCLIFSIENIKLHVAFKRNWNLEHKNLLCVLSGSIWESATLLYKDYSFMLKHYIIILFWQFTKKLNHFFFTYLRQTNFWIFSYLLYLGYWTSQSSFEIMLW